MVVVVVVVFKITLLRNYIKVIDDRYFFLFRPSTQFSVAVPFLRGLMLMAGDVA